MAAEKKKGNIIKQDLHVACTVDVQKGLWLCFLSFPPESLRAGGRPGHTGVWGLFYCIYALEQLHRLKVQLRLWPHVMIRQPR